MAVYKNFEEMPLWRESMEFAVAIYRTCDQRTFDLRLKDQLRAASASVASNIAEGFEYKDRKNFVRFLVYAKASSAEALTQLTILHRVGKIDNPEFEQLSSMALTLGRKIGGMIQYLKKDNSLDHPESGIRNS